MRGVLATAETDLGPLFPHKAEYDLRERKGKRSFRPVGGPGNPGRAIRPLCSRENSKGAYTSRIRNAQGSRSKGGCDRDDLLLFYTHDVLVVSKGRPKGGLRSFVKNFGMAVSF